MNITKVEKFEIFYIDDLLIFVVYTQCNIEIICRCDLPF